MRQQNENEDAAPMRPPFTSKLFAPKIYDENKYPLNITRPLTENNSHKLPVASAAVDCPVKHNDLTEKENKENKSDIDEQPIVTKRMGRDSMCTTAQRILPTPAPRRNSLIPMRIISAVPKFSPPLFPLRPIQAEEVEEDSNWDGSKCLPKLTTQDSPKELKTAKELTVQQIVRHLSAKTGTFCLDVTIEVTIHQETDGPPDRPSLGGQKWDILPRLDGLSNFWRPTISTVAQWPEKGLLPWLDGIIDGPPRTWRSFRSTVRVGRFRHRLVKWA
ncbi:hypothetical protein BC332_23352 [Capsicum chinense]|nr:hypothetical protein BC332_23352 [Capsicum chinense]